MTKAKQPSREQQAKIAREILRVREDLFYFLENYCWTLNEDAEPGESPIQRFPKRSERPELYELAGLWWNKDNDPELRYLAIDKSRQMMGTWVFVVCDLWDTAFHDGVNTFFQSKKEKDAINILERAWFTFQKFPKWLQPTHQKKETELIFPNRNSKIWAIPQGGDHIRSYTASNIFSDEAAKQPEFGEAVAASVPSLGKHGRLHALTTARGKGNAWWRVRIKPPAVKSLDGYPVLKPKLNQRNFVTAFLDYRFNPKYDEEWIKRIQATMSAAEWNREYEGSYEEAVGTPVLNADIGLHFQDIAWVDGKVFWRGWDFGYRKPACIVTQVNPITGQWYWLWGVVGENEYLKDFAPRVFEICDAKFPPSRDANGKMQDQMWLDYCDPAGTQKTDKSDTTSIQILEDKYHARYGKRMSLRFRKMSFEDGIGLIRDKLKLRPDGQPGLLVNKDFIDARDGLMGGYHFPEDRRSGAQGEYPQDDGYFIHLFDAVRYIAVCEFEAVEHSAIADSHLWPKPWEESLSQYTGY